MAVPSPNVVPTWGSATPISAGFSEASNAPRAAVTSTAALACAGTSRRVLVGDAADDASGVSNLDQLPCAD